MSKSTTIRAIAKRAGVRARAVLATLPVVGVTGKLKYSKKIDKSLSLELQRHLAPPYFEDECVGKKQVVFDELDSFEIFDDWELPVTELCPEPVPSVAMGEVLQQVSPATVVEIPAPIATVQFVESPKQVLVANIDRYLYAIEKATSKALADLEERSNRLRCLESFEMLYQLLAQIGIPSGTRVRSWEWKERGEVHFSVYQRILFSELGDDLVSALNLKPLLITARKYRHAVAHATPCHLSAATIRWIADGLDNLILDLLECCAALAAESDDEVEANPTESFYELFRIRQTTLCMSDEGA